MSESTSLLRIEQARTAEGLRDFASVLAELEGDAEILRFYEATCEESLAEGSGQLFFVGYWGALAVATCELMLGPGGVAGLYGVATRQEFRRRGFAKALVREAMQVARNKGMSRIVIEAEGGELGFYEKLGFERLPGSAGQGGCFSLVFSLLFSWADEP